jgi:BlaI family transcriptional regulator, penicillinase repressor
MRQENTGSLSRRERQIMDIIYSKNFASALEVMENLSDKPSYSTVRALLRILENKGYLKHKTDKQKYIFYPTISRKKATRNAIRNLLSIFFNNSAEQAMAALLEYKKDELTENDLKRLLEIVENVRKEDIDNG